MPTWGETHCASVYVEGLWTGLLTELVHVHGGCWTHAWTPWLVQERRIQVGWCLRSHGLLRHPRAERPRDAYSTCWLQPVQ